MPLDIPSSVRPRISLAAVWIIFCSYCGLLGLGLSLLHQLNAVGYVVSLGLGLLAFALWKKNSRAVFFRPYGCRRLQRRFKRGLPLGFLIVGGLAILGGLLHPPSNYDGLAYRTPRVLHWLVEGRWHWIHTDFNRLNTRGPAFEWLTAPIFALARTDRFEFILTSICFLLLPGRVFSIWRRLGVRPRVAWQWMWILPTAYCYVTQAGSICNDLFGAVLALTGFQFALRARASGKLGDLVVGIFAAALMTSAKAYNLLLLLPWVVAVGPALWLLLKRPMVSMAALILAAGVSLVPMSVMNYRNCGDWTGQKAESMDLLGNSDPLLRFGGNIILIGLNNFAPPVFPFATSWKHFTQSIIPPRLAARLSENFEMEPSRFEIPEMQMEGSAGLGLAVNTLLVITLIRRWQRRSGKRISISEVFAGLKEVRWLVPIVTWAMTAFFMSQTGMECPGRFLAPFYPLIVAPIVAGGGDWMQMMRRLWWQRAAILVITSAGILIAIAPARYLWPAETILKAFGGENSSHFLVKRAARVYSVFGDRSDAFAAAIALLPPGVTTLGVVISDDPEASLWRPFGSRRIEHVRKTDGPEYLRERNIQYVLVSPFVLRNNQSTIEEWLKKYNGEIVQTVTLTTRIRLGPGEWWLVKVH